MEIIRTKKLTQVWLVSGNIELFFLIPIHARLSENGFRSDFSNLHFVEREREAGTDTNRKMIINEASCRV